MGLTCHVRINPLVFALFVVASFRVGMLSIGCVIDRPCVVSIGRLRWVHVWCVDAVVTVAVTAVIVAVVVVIVGCRRICVEPVPRSPSLNLPCRC